MVEVVNNRQYEDVEKPSEELQNDSNTIVYSEDNQLDVKTTGDTDENNKVSEGSQLSSSKWSQLTRLLRLGLGRDSELSQGGNSSKEGNTLMQGDLKPMEKRGSLGKIFRQGFAGFPRPMSAREPMKSEFGSNDSANDSPQSKKGAKWNVFKHRKSLHQLSESDENQIKDDAKDENKKRPLSKMLHYRTRSRKECEDAESADGASNEEHTPPSPQSRIQSLGKFFRQNKNPDFLESTYDKNQQKADPKKNEIEW